VTWGDEYEGVLADTDQSDADFHAASPSFAADALFAETRTVRATGSLGPLGARYRESGSGRAGALEWNTARLSVIAGAVRASLGEGAILADARDAAAVEPRGTRALHGFRLSPSSSTWGSSLGGGVRASLGRIRVAGGAWQAWEFADDARAFVSAGVVAARGAMFAAVGRSRTGAGAASIAAAHAGAAFVSGEIGIAPDGARAVARVIAGENGEWRALVATGAPSGGSDTSPAAAGARWGGAVERRGNLGRVAARAVLSSRTRRDGPDLEQRQRAEGQASLGAAGARLEANVRATRETLASATDVLQAREAVVVHDDVRVRCVVRTAESFGERLRVEQSYRVDFIVSGAGPAGRVIAWSARTRWNALDARVQASAFDLAPGQLAYTGRAVLPGAAPFTTLSHSGVDLSASVRMRIGWGAVVGVQGVRTGAGEARIVLQAGVVL
jgi:hypothetical protein